MSVLDLILRNCAFEPATGCHLWLGALTRDGYPRVSVRGKTRRAHRVVLAASLRRPLNRAEFACHRCDVRSCCAPEHLFAGTNLTNVQDKVAKGRQARTPSKRVLTWPKVKAIVRARQKNVPTRVVAERYGVSVRQVQRICAGTRWAR